MTKELIYSVSKVSFLVMPNQRAFEIDYCKKLCWLIYSSSGGELFKDIKKDFLPVVIGFAEKLDGDTFFISFQFSLD